MKQKLGLCNLILVNFKIGVTLHFKTMASFNENLLFTAKNLLSYVTNTCLMTLCISTKQRDQITSYTHKKIILHFSSSHFINGKCPIPTNRIILDILHIRQLLQILNMQLNNIRMRIQYRQSINFIQWPTIMQRNCCW